MPESEIRLDAFYRMLRTRRYAVPAPQQKTSQWEKLDSLLKEDAEKSWTSAYEAEEILIWLIPDADLQAMFDGLYLEAVSVIGEDLAEKRRENFKEALKLGTSPAQSPRIALQALAEDVHEHWANEDERLEYYNMITKGTSIFLLSFVGALLVGLLLVLWNPFNASWQPSLHNVCLLFVVLSAGLVGAGMSMMIGLNDRMEKVSMTGLEKMALATNRWGRSAIGATAALGLFAMCLAGLLEGKTMPQLTFKGEAALLKALPPESLAHIVVVCIVAGFSEKFVPTKLGELEK